MPKLLGMTKSCNQLMVLCSTRSLGGAQPSYVATFLLAKLWSLSVIIFMVTNLLKEGGIVATKLRKANITSVDDGIVSCESFGETSYKPNYVICAGDGKLANNHLSL